MSVFKMKVSHLSCDSHTSFKVKRSKVRVTRPINADTHPSECELTAHHWLAYFSATSVSICTKLARSIPIRGRNIVSKLNFRKSFSKSRICRRKTVSCQFRPSMQQDLLQADRSIAYRSCYACYSTHHFQGQRSRSQAHVVRLSVRRTAPFLNSGNTRSPATAGKANRPLLFLEHRIPMPELFTVRHFTRVLEAGKYGCPY